MAAELQIAPRSELEFKWVGGEEARRLDKDHLDWPADSHVLFVMENGEVVARSSMTILPVLQYPIVEATWVREDKQKGTLAYRVLKEVENHFIEFGKTHIFAFAYDGQPEVGDYLTRVGYERKPLAVYMKQLVNENGERI